MLEKCRTVYLGGTGEITEKKSRFIADVRPVKTEEEALSFLEEIRKKYWDARHHCFAWVIGERREIMRGGDDGEPSGTAGRPMLDVLLGEDLYDTAVVVTRYFGGTLLGTGGLVRAYSAAVQAGLEESILIEKKAGVLLSIHTDYNGIGKIQYLLGQKKIPILESEYAEEVAMRVIVPAALEGKFLSEVTEATNGRAHIEKLETCYYAELDGEILLGDRLRGKSR